LRATQESKKNGSIWGDFKATFMAVILKKDSPALVFEYFRLINELCSSIYKRIAKVIVMHLKSILLEAISKDFFGFLRGN
jgi:hypothetical protein